jgi:hypothetical protein
MTDTRKNYIRGILITLIFHEKNRETAVEEIFEILDIEKNKREKIIKGILLKYNSLNISNVTRVANEINEEINR